MSLSQLVFVCKWTRKQPPGKSFRDEGVYKATNIHFRFLTDINEMQASARTSLCRLYTDTCAHADTRHMQPIVHSRPKAWAMDATAVPRAHLFISLYLLGPTDSDDSPPSPQMRPFLPKREAENIHAVSHVLLSKFFSSSIEEKNPSSGGR